MELENIGQLQQEILRELQNHIDPLFQSVSAKAELQVKKLVKNALTTAPEYYAMLPGGSLYSEIGNPNIEKDLGVIIDLLINKIELDSAFAPILSSSNTLSGSFELNLIDDNFGDILALNEASFTTEKGSVLPYLRWMLLDGVGAKLIINYKYLPYTPKGHVSRTHGGIMVHSKGFWSLPAFAGTKGDNWITRSMDRIRDVVEITIENEFKKVFN